MTKKGRNTIRDSKRDHRIELRVTKEELEFIDRLSSENRMNRNQMIMTTIFRYALSYSRSIPLDTIKDFEIIRKRL